MAIEARETLNLIGSDKVEGTAVYDADDEKIGTIARVMIDKISGQVAYVVVGFGGFLGAGEDYYPLPWHSLSYDSGLGGYMTTINAERLKDAPKYGAEADWDWSDPARNRTVDEYYPCSNPQQGSATGSRRTFL